jgi:hypothetical protein
MVDQRSKKVAETDETLAHPGSEHDPVVGWTAAVALVAADFVPANRPSPVDRVEEWDALVADGLEAGERHLDQLPLDEIEQGSIRRRHPRGRLRQRR